MRIFNRILSLILIISMLFGMVPQVALTTFAAEEDTAITEAEAVFTEEVLYSAAVVMASEDGFAYTVDEAAGSATVTGYTGAERDLVIPEQLGGYPVRKIGNSAFADTVLTSLVLPASLTAMGSNILKDKPH